MPTAFTTALAPARLAPRRAAPARKRSHHHRIAPIPGSVGAPRAMSQFAFDAARTDAAKTLSDYVSDDDAPWPNATPSRLVTRAVAPRRGSAARPPPRRFNGRYHAHFAPLPTPTTPRDSMPGAVRPSRHEDCVGDWCDETYERTMFANDLALSADNGLLDAPGPARPPRHSIDRARDVVVFMEDGDVEYGLFENDVVPAPAGLPKKPVKPLPPPKRVMTGRYHASYAPKATRREIADAIGGKNNAVSRVVEKNPRKQKQPRTIPLISRYVSDSPEHREDFPAVWGTKDRRVAVINEIIERRLAGAAEQCGDVDWNNASDLFAGADPFGGPSGGDVQCGQDVDAIMNTIATHAVFSEAAGVVRELCDVGGVAAAKAITSWCESHRTVRNAPELMRVAEEEMKYGAMAW